MKYNMRMHSFFRFSCDMFACLLFLNAVSSVGAQPTTTSLVAVWPLDAKYNLPCYDATGIAILPLGVGAATLLPNGGPFSTGSYTNPSVSPPGFVSSCQIALSTPFLTVSWHLKLTNNNGVNHHFWPFSLYSNFDVRYVLGKFTLSLASNGLIQTGMSYNTTNYGQWVFFAISINAQTGNVTGYQAPSGSNGSAMSTFTVSIKSLGLSTGPTTAKVFDNGGIHAGEEVTCVSLYSEVLSSDQVQQLRSACPIPLVTTTPTVTSTTSNGIQQLITTMPPTTQTIVATAVPTLGLTTTAQQSSKSIQQSITTTTQTTVAASTTVATALPAGGSVTTTQPLSNDIQQQSITTTTQTIVAAVTTVATALPIGGPVTTTQPARECRAVSSTIATTVQPSAPARGIQAEITTMGQQRDEALDNTTAILQRCDHFKAARFSPPLNADGKPLPIAMYLEIEGLDAISNQDETISVGAEILLKWQVTTCPWQSSTVMTDRPWEEIYVVSAQEVWQPQLRFTSASHWDIYMKQVRDGDDFLVTVNSNQVTDYRTFTFFWTREGYFTSQCELHLDLFPFDTQICTFEFTLQRATNLIAFDSSNMGLIVVDDATTNTEWKLISNNTSVTNDRFNGFSVSKAIFSMTLKRIPEYYLENFAMPTAVLGFMNLASFLMPPDLPDRPIVTVTLLLTLSVSETAVLGELPKKPHASLLGRYSQVMTAYSAVCTLYHLLAMWLSASIEPKWRSCRKCTNRISPVRMLDVFGVVIAFVTFGAIHGYYISYF